MAITDTIESMYNHTGEAYDMVEEKGGNVLNPLAHNLPDEYQEVDYIESYGNEYIKLTEPTKDGDLVETEIISKTYIGGLYGATDIAYANRRHLYFTDSNRVINLGYDVTGLCKIPINTNELLTIKAYFDNGNQWLNINGVEEHSSQTTSTENKYNATLFTRAKANSIDVSQNVKIKMNYFRKTNNGVEKYNLIPCYIKSTNEVGMYDLVSQQFFGNAGTGAFTYGTEIPKYLDKNLENLSQAISTIDTHTEELEEMRAEMQKPTLNVFSNVDEQTSYAEYKDALKDYSSAFMKYMEYNSNEEVGTSEVKLENALSTNALSVSIKGNTEQQTTTGRNLTNIKNATYTKNGVTIVANNGKLKITGTCTGSTSIWVMFEEIITLPADTYTLFAGKPTLPISINIDVAGIGINVGYEKNTTTKQLTEQKTSDSLEIRTINGVTYDMEITPMLVKGSYTDTTIPSYEPYTGGIPAPNPDYPQEIKTLSEGKVVVSGKNKLINTAKNKTTNGIEYIVNPDKSITINGTATANAVLVLFGKIGDTTNKIILDKRYTISYQNTTDYGISIDMYKDGSTYYAYCDGNRTISVTEPQNVNYITLTVIKGYTYSNKTIYPMIRDAEIEDNTYTPYIEPTEIDLPLHSKNLFDKNGALQGYRIDSVGALYRDNNYFTSDFIELKSNQDYVFYLEKIGGSTAYAIYNENKQFLNRELNLKTNVNVIEKSNSKRYLRISCYLTDLDLVQIEEGTQATDYEPYYNYELTSQDTLNIGYDGNTSIEKKWGKLVLTGDENWSINISSDTRTVFLSNNIFNDIVDYDDKTKIPNLICTHFVSVSQSKTWTYGDIARHISNQKGIYLCVGANETVDAFKNWLKAQYNSGTPVTIYYELANPEIVELENTQIPLLPDVNNISIESNVEPTELKVKYALDIFSEQPQLLSEVADDE